MKQINLVFEDDFSDVDILLVPDYVAENIDHIVLEFNKWLLKPENRLQFLAPYKGKMELAIGTEEFLWWLNNCFIQENDASTILKQHTTLCPTYPAAYF